MSAGETTLRLRLVHVWYFMGQGKAGAGRVPIMELFGRCDDGRSATVLHQGFFPYFYIPEPGPDVARLLKQDPEVRTVEMARLLNSVDTESAAAIE